MSWLNNATIKTAEEIQAEALNAQRQALKTTRDAAFEALTYTFEDGREIQTRPEKDSGNIETAIKLGKDKNWLLANNTKAVVTVAELQEALADGTARAEAIWDDYIDAVTALEG